MNIVNIYIFRCNVRVLLSRMTFPIQVQNQVKDENYASNEKQPPTPSLTLCLLSGLLRPHLDTD